MKIYFKQTMPGQHSLQRVQSGIRRQIAYSELSHPAGDARDDARLIWPGIDVNIRSAELRQICGQSGPYISLIAPVFQITPRQQTVAGFIAHAGAQKPHADCKTGTVRRRIPAGIRPNAIEQALIAQMAHERVIRPVGKRNIRDADRPASLCIAFHHADEGARRHPIRSVIKQCSFGRRNHIGLPRPAILIRIDQQHQIRPLRTAHQHPSGSQNGGPNRCANAAVRIARHRIGSRTVVIPGINKRNLMLDVVNRPAQQQNTEFIDPRLQLELRLRQTSRILLQHTPLAVRLRQRGIVVLANDKVTEHALPCKIDHPAADRQILASPRQPILPDIRRNSLSAPLHLLFFLRIEARRFRLVLQRRNTEKIGPVFLIIQRLLLSGSRSIDRRPHQRPEYIQSQSRVLLPQPDKLGGPAAQNLLWRLMLAGRNQSAVNHRIGRNHRRLRPADMLPSPCPQRIRLSRLFRAAAQQLLRRHDYLIPHRPDNIGALLP